MPETTIADPLLEPLVNDFGGNYVFALDVLEQYRQDRYAVEPSWRDYFDDLLGVTPEPPARSSTPSPTTGSMIRHEQAVSVRDKTKALAIPAILPGDIATPIRGGALRIVENMEASLLVPTATSVRTIPVRTLEENRRILNKHRDATGAGKVSFTHLTAWAILRALEAFPRLNDA
jgi:2-oxoglutarate decarboxylase